MEIKWNQKLFGVEIKDNENHFVISAQPSMVINWHDSIRFYKDNKIWQLPTREQLQLVGKHINKVNTLIKSSRGYEIQGWHWTVDEYDKFCAWRVSMYRSNISYSNKGNNNYVHAVSTL